MRRHRPAARRAFSLVELLVVLVIIGILSGLVVMGIGSLGGAARLTSAADSLRGEMDLARTTAQAQNRPVAVCFYKLTEESGSGKAWRAVATYIWNDANEDWSPLRPPRVLPEGVVIMDSQEHSTLPLKLTTSGSTTAPAVPRTLSGMGATDTDMKYFTFRSNGAADLSTSDDWYATLVPAREASGSLPDNWATVQLQPLTGSLKVLRP